MTPPALRIHAKAPPRRRVRGSALVELAAPPREAQPWPIDAVPADIATDYGVHKWTERSAREVWARYAERGNRLLLDVEHNAGVHEDDEPAATAGYADLELRAGVPWLVCDWSAYGAEQIATKQRRYLSAEYDIDPDTNEIIALYRVSLVADPATYRARILASAPKEASMDLAVVLAALRAALAAEDPAVAKEAIANLVDQLGAELAPGAPPADDTPPPPAEPAFAAAPANDGDDKKDKPPVATSAPIAAAAPAPAPKPAATVAASAPSADESARNAERSENALRDMLLVQHGHRLAPSIRVWASRQPLSIVRGLIDAAPDAPAPPTRVTATRGEGHGTGTGNVRRGLQGEALEQYQRQMGTFQASTPKVPYLDLERGERVFPTVPPRELQRALAAEAAGKTGGR